MKDEVIKERERIRKLVEDKINSRINWRKKNKASLGFISHFEKLKDDLLFLITSFIKLFFYSIQLFFNIY